MINVDNEIERVLAELKEIEPDPHFESRVLSAVLARTSCKDNRTRSASRIFRLNLTRQFAFRISLAGAVVLLLAIILIHQNLKHSSQSASSSHPAQFAAPAPALDLPHPTNMNTTPSISSATHRAHAPVTPHVESLDERALAEMNAPSHPAPQAPLTTEERLLVSVIRHETPQLFAMLNPVQREEQEAEERAEFEASFNQTFTED